MSVDTLCNVSSKVYLGTSDIITWVLLLDGVTEADLSAITRAVLDVGATTVDTDVVAAGTVWWTDTDTYNGATVDVFKLVLGGLSIPPGTYSNCRFTIYDATYPNGRPLSYSISLEVIL